MNHAIIDIGSNTIRLSVYECDGESVTAFFTKKTMAGLVGYVKKAALTEEGIACCIKTLLDYQRLLSHFTLASLHVFATASLRNVENTEAAVLEIHKRTGILVDILSGEEEAHLDFVGAVHAMELYDGLLIDIGGGSTELVSYQQKKPVHSVSFSLGSLSLFSEYVSGILPAKEERKAIRHEIRERLASLTEFHDGVYETVCGVGGTIRAVQKLANHHYGHSAENRSFDADAAKELLRIYKNPDKKELRELLLLLPDRMHTILPGMLLLSQLLECFHSEKVYVSEYGVREGYLFERVLKKLCADPACLPDKSILA